MDRHLGSQTWWRMIAAQGLSPVLLPREAVRSFQSARSAVVRSSEALRSNHHAQMPMFHPCPLTPLERPARIISICAAAAAHASTSHQPLASTPSSQHPAPEQPSASTPALPFPWRQGPRRLSPAPPARIPQHRPTAPTAYSSNLLDHWVLAACSVKPVRLPSARESCPGCASGRTHTETRCQPYFFLSSPLVTLECACLRSYTPKTNVYIFKSAQKS